MLCHLSANAQSLNRFGLGGKAVYDFNSWCCQFGTPGTRMNAGVLFTTIFGQNIDWAVGAKVQAQDF
jgi:hypothetical protein